MAITKISDSELSEQKRFHADLEDIPQKSAAEMKAFMDYVPRQVIIPKVNELADSVNKLAEREKETAADIVVESGEFGNWTYQKYSSGICICFADTHYMCDICEITGDFYKSQVFGETLPTEMFTQVISANISVRTGIEGDLINAYVYEQNTEEILFFLATYSGMKVADHFDISFFVVGKWR